MKVVCDTRGTENDEEHRRQKDFGRRRKQARRIARKGSRYAQCILGTRSLAEKYSNGARRMHGEWAKRTQCIRGNPRKVSWWDELNDFYSRKGRLNLGRLKHSQLSRKVQVTGTGVSIDRIFRLTEPIGLIAQCIVLSIICLNKLSRDSDRMIENQNQATESHVKADPTI